MRFWAFELGLYRVAHHVSDLGWVDFDLDVPLYSLTCSAHSASLSSAQAESGRQIVKLPKSKSTQPRSETCWANLYVLNVISIVTHLVAVGDGGWLVARLWHDVGGVALRLEECVAYDLV